LLVSKKGEGRRKKEEGRRKKEKVKRNEGMKPVCRSLQSR